MGSTGQEDGSEGQLLTGIGILTLCYVDPTAAGCRVGIGLPEMLSPAADEADRSILRIERIGSYDIVGSDEAQLKVFDRYHLRIAGSEGTCETEQEGVEIRVDRIVQVKRLYQLRGYVGRAVVGSRIFEKGS